ncbi:MAG: FAD binding domain-containing protein, partial [Rhodospirillaceae bacterium]|nr:FAD binding domain-containing protein [Rhodospirillaceae bacterium]
MTPFDLAEPRRLADAVALLDPADPGIRAVAGGTALMLMMKTGFFKPAKLVSLRRIEPEHARIATTAAGGLRIGAMAPLASMERSAEVKRAAPVIVRALRRLSNVRVRNVATVGGNLAHADPHMDLPPVLIALGATVAILGPKGERVLPVENLIGGYYETALAGDELIARLDVPPQDARRAAYLKVTTRSADDWPALGIAASLDVADGVVRNARLVLSAATDRPVRLAAAEAALAGARADAKALARAGDAAAAEVELVGDARGSAPYKRELVRVYVRRALDAALQAEAGVTP